MTMVPLVLEGETLGQKHRHYNSLVKAAATDHTRSLELVNYSEPDADNLLRIDVACARRDVPYILEVLKSPDLLYVTRAIKRSAWLITDAQYAHIINPDYLERELYPSMTAKARIKLISAIKLNLKDEARIDTFFSYYKHDPRTAMKWMHSCSEAVIKFAQEQAGRFSVKQIIRMCRKSITILEAYCKQYQAIHKKEVLEKATNLLHCHCKQYLDIVDFVEYYYKPKFKKKATQIIMDKCRERVIEHFEDYCDILDIPTFAQNLKSEFIQDFILKQKKIKYLYDYWFNFENLRHFLKYIPNEKRIPFIALLFLVEVSAPTDNLKAEEEHSNQCNLINAPSPVDYTHQLGKRLAALTNEYRWYLYESFDIAMDELKILITLGRSPAERLKLLKILVKLAGSNQQKLHTILEFYQNHHVNEPLKYKMRFVNTFLFSIKTCKFDDKTWHSLNNLFISLGVYTKYDNKVKFCVNAIIVYTVLHDQLIPETIENKFKFSSLKDYRNKLNKIEQTKIFNYLHNNLMKAIHIRVVTNESNVTGVVEKLCEILNLFADWNKQLDHYPVLINKIKDVINIKRHNCWEFDLSNLYKAAKPWRKLFFEESLVLHPSDEACLNALKHDPVLFSRYPSDVEFILLNVKTIERVLRKTRIYWSESIRPQWIDFYLQRIEQPIHEKTVKHIFILMPRSKILPLIREHAPVEPDIEWNDSDEWKPMLKKNIAKFMHLISPPLNLDTVLMYIKGNYLDISLHSLNAVLNNMSSDVSSKYLIDLLDTPISLQKHGIRAVLKKLNIRDIKETIAIFWNNTMNFSVKMVILRETFELLCNPKNIDFIGDIWELIAMYIDSMMSKENRDLFIVLVKLRDVPILIRPLFFMKGYLYLKSLPVKTNSDNIITLYFEEAITLVDVLEPGFVEKELLESLEDNFHGIKNKLPKNFEILTAYILSCKTEETQMLRYEKLLLPILKKVLSSWNLHHKSKYPVKVRLNSIILDLIRNLTYRTASNKNIVPRKLFRVIQLELTKALIYEENYDILLTWNIATLFVERLDIYVKENPQIYVDEEEELIKETTSWICSNIMPFGFIKDNNKLWKNICQAIAEPFGNACVNYLKQDTILNQYPVLYICVKDILKDNILYSLDFDNRSRIIFLTAMLTDNITSVYCLVISYLPHLNFYDMKLLRRELFKILRSNTSIDVKIHLSHYDDTHVRLYLESESEDDQTPNCQKRH